MNTNLKISNPKKNVNTGAFALQIWLIVSVISIFIIALLVGCKKVDPVNDGEGQSVNNPQKTNFNMRMTDAPGDYDAVNVEIISAEVHSDVNGWVALNVKPGIYNLLDLTNGKDTLIANGQVAVGKVSQIRLILGNNNTVVIDSQTYALSTPSAQQSGLKLNVSATLVAGIDYNMLIDFDADKSIVKTGNGKYILKPVIRVVSSAVNGSIKGIVLPLLTQPAIYVISGTDTLSTSADILTGGFYVGGLKAGSYNVWIMPKSPYTDTTFANIGVTLGVQTDLGIITLK